MFKFLLLFSLLLFIQPSYADFIRMTNNAPNYMGYNSFKPNHSTIGINGTNKIKNRYLTRRRPINNAYPYGYTSIPHNELNALEKYAFKKNFKRETDIERLQRLESLAFGAIQEGDIRTRYQNVENAILSRPQQTQKRSILGNLANYFIGQATGFTPSLTNDMTQGYIPGLTPYGGSGSYFPSPAFNNNRVEQYSNGIFGGGYRVFDNNFGNGSSVKILD
ncbi:MAG: hypothetical protein E7Z89_00015 [Cyanobacteria bacterium SIG28]|nr:hypothetical protein [Cyanobacteria bacterium SIG28]